MIADIRDSLMHIGTGLAQLCVPTATAIFHPLPLKLLVRGAQLAKPCSSQVNSSFALSEYLTPFTFSPRFTAFLALSASVSG